MSDAKANTGSGLEGAAFRFDWALSQTSAPASEFNPIVPFGYSPTLAQASDAAKGHGEKSEKAKEAKESKAGEAKRLPLSEFWIVNTLRAEPMLAIFLTLGLGYWVGTLKFGHFSLGAVTGVLLAGILVGQLVIPISAEVKTIFFYFFVFAVGYGIGPQFVRGIVQDGGPQALFAVIVSLMCLGGVYLAAVVAGYGSGLAAGLLAGSQTISASIGLATDAINNLGLGEQTKTELGYIPVAYAVTYIFGTFGTGLILVFLGPKLIGINLESECKRYQAEMSEDDADSGDETAWREFDMRTFRVSPDVVGKTVAEAEASVPGTRLFIDGIKRKRTLIEVEPTTVLQEDDVVAVSGPTEGLVEQVSSIATEVVERDLLMVPVETVDLVMSNEAHDGKTVRAIGKQEIARGVHLHKITRGVISVDVPTFARSKIYRGDILTISGTHTNTARFIEEMGYVDRPSSMTDMIWVGIFVVIGGLIGALTVEIKGVPITLSTSAGVLLAGIFLGWLRAIRPLFGHVPAPSLWFMNSVGLNVFIAVVGISAGPTFIEGLKEAGISLFFLGMFASAMPMLLAPLIGKYVFRFDPAINLGVCAGARTSTAFVAMVEDVAKSNVPMLGYTVPFAVGTMLNTLWGMVIVLLLA